MAAVYEMIVRAAQTDATVLLHGETGTGKGLLARAIHVNSARREAPFVHVDCTTLPAALVESELFGHERGAYTGADSRVIGKVEAADGGTLFLDEIGELPLPLQGKLLRFVQERKFERIGGRETLTRRRADRRRDEPRSRGDGERGPVPQRSLLPAARRRDRDPAAARARWRRHRRSRDALRRSVRAPLPQGPAAARRDASRRRSPPYAWPGNVRELENTIERAVVLCERHVDRGQGSRLEQRRQTGAIAIPARLDSSIGDPDRVPAPARRCDHAARRTSRSRRPSAATRSAVLDRASGNQSAAARALGITRNKLARLLK